jgi:hypothetical protein
MSRRSHIARGAISALFCLTSSVAWAIDEIQVYDAGIANIGQWTIQQHLNYTFSGRKVPDFPGGIVPNHALSGTPELAYGLTDWWEFGLYAPFAVTGDGRFLSNGAKIRNLFVSPHAAQRNFFYGVNFEASYQTPAFSQSRYGLEIRPILGVRNPEWEFIVNPIVDVSFGSQGEADFTPAARIARRLGNDSAVAIEYYADFGKIGHFLPVQEQQHQVFGVVDFKLGAFDIDFGIGYGLTSGSDRLLAKAIIGYAFPAPNASPTDTGTIMQRPQTEKVSNGKIR